MPQRSVTTSSPVGYTISTLQSLVTALQAAMVNGQPIVAADIISIKTQFYDLWRTHTHTAQDLQGIDTFGNLTTYGTVGSELLISSGVPLANAQPAATTPTFAAGTAITAADINAMIAIINNMRTHAHEVDDGVGGITPVVSIADATYTALVFDAGATATLSFQNDGVLVGADAGAVAAQWIDLRPVDLATASAYDIMVTVVSGTAPSGSALGTWLNLGTTQSWSLTAPFIGSSNVVAAVLSVQIRNASTAAIVDTATITLQADSEVTPTVTCFPAGCYVLMGDGAWKVIQDITPGELVMGMNGPVPVLKMDRPMLGARKMLRFADASLRWSEEHAMWTKDAAGSQWWWSANRALWKREADMGAIGGLEDNETMRTGDQAAAWAHVDGWRTNEIFTEDPLPFTTRLYLPITQGSPIIVNGYVVGAGVNQQGFDYAALDWNTVLGTMPVVQPLPTA